MGPECESESGKHNKFGIMKYWKRDLPVQTGWTSVGPSPPPATGPFERRPSSRRRRLPTEPVHAKPAQVPNFKLFLAKLSHKLAALLTSKV